MRRKNVAGYKYDKDLNAQIDANQKDIVDELIHPHSTRLDEIIGPCFQIRSKIPAQDPAVYAQPVSARGRIVWNRAYSYQAGVPSYLDPVPDPPMSYGH